VPAGIKIGLCFQNIAILVTGEQIDGHVENKASACQYELVEA